MHLAGTSVDVWYNETTVSVRLKSKDKRESVITAVLKAALKKTGSKKGSKLTLKHRKSEKSSDKALTDSGKRSLFFFFLFVLFF
jgi:hypothetical protein